MSVMGPMSRMGHMSPKSPGENSPRKHTYPVRKLFIVFRRLFPHES